MEKSDQSAAPTATDLPNQAGGESLAAERARALAAEAEAAQLRAIFQTMTVGLIVFDGDGQVRSSNAAGREMLAQAGVADPFGQPSARRPPAGRVSDAKGEPLPRAQWPIYRLLAGEALTSEQAIDIRYQRGNGPERLFNISGAPLRDADGAVSGAVVVLRDVTAQRAIEGRTGETLEALLAMAEVLVQAPAELATAAVATAEASEAQSSEAARGPQGQRSPGGASSPAQDVTAHRLGQLTQRVLGCERLWIVTVDVEQGRQTPVAVVGLPEEQVAAWWAQTEQSPFADHPQFQFIGRLEAGESVILDMRRPPFSEPPLADQPNPYGVRSTLIAPMRVRGRLIGMLAYDYGPVDHEFGEQELALAEGVAKLAALVLERERLLRERAVAQADALALREANRRMDEFVGIMAHELRTPLTSIVANIQIVARQLGQAQARGLDATPPEELRVLLDRLIPALERSDRQGARLSRLVADLLDLSRIQSGNIVLRREVVGLATLVREVVEEQRQTHPNRTITLAIPAELEQVRVDADGDRIAQVVTNYLTNALKYSAADRAVEVTMRREGQGAAEGVQVAVRDHGPGIPKAEQERVWERFFRGSDARVVSGSGVGLGLGLYISRTIIERHGGQVALRSAPGKGSTFSFKLPVASDIAG
jgi:signal transduction histidine kinase